jgi:hypothetical protein
MPENQKKTCSHPDRTALIRVLESLHAPCYESRLIAAAFPGFSISDASPLSLYRTHFRLFHMLYKLQDEYRTQNRYLHIHFMRIHLTDYPEPGKCRHYEPTTGRFCEQRTIPETPHCAFHARMMKENLPKLATLRAFYLDPKNIDAFDEITIEKFLRGAQLFMKSAEEIRNAFKTLKIPETYNRKTIQDAFRKRAKETHPDTGAGSEPAFQKIQSAYRLLITAIPSD